jgi:hypothetical protein
MARSSCRFLALLLALSAVHAAEAATPPGSASVLLRVRLTEVSPSLGFSSTRESFIFRDGLVVERGSDNADRCWVTRAAGSAAMLGDLQQALAQNHVGLQAGNCQIKEPVDNFVAERTVTWFGRGARQHTYRTGNALLGPCPDETVEIDRAIRFFLANAAGAQTTFFPCP